MLLPFLFSLSASFAVIHSLFQCNNKFLYKWRTIKWKGKQTQFDMYTCVCVCAVVPTEWISNASFVLCERYATEWAYNTVSVSVSVYLFMVIDLENKWVNWSRLSPTQTMHGRKKRNSESVVWHCAMIGYGSQKEFSSTLCTHNLFLIKLHLRSCRKTALAHIKILAESQGTSQFHIQCTNLLLHSCDWPNKKCNMLLNVNMAWAIPIKCSGAAKFGEFDSSDPNFRMRQTMKVNSLPLEIHRIYYIRIQMVILVLRISCEKVNEYFNNDTDMIRFKSIWFLIRIPLNSIQCMHWTAVHFIALAFSINITAKDQKGQFTCYTCSCRIKSTRTDLQHKTLELRF